MCEKQNYRYDPEEEKEAGYASLWDVLMGFTSPAKRPWVRLPRQRPYNVHILALHEIVHYRLFGFTTVGNIQQLLALVLMAQGLDEELRGRIEDMLKFSIHSTRFIHEGCATYTSIHQAELFEPTASASDIQTMPAYCAGAMEFFDDYLKPILVSQESKIVLAQAVTRFALSPNIYELFKNFWDISSKWDDVFSTIADRCAKLLSIFSHKAVRNSFAVEYERFVLRLHGGKVNKMSSHEAALKELFWLYRFFTLQLPELDIFAPDKIPQSRSIAKHWEGQLRNAGVRAANLDLKMLSRDDVDAGVIVKLPTAGRQGSNMVRIVSLERFQEFVRNTAIFAQVYVHRKDIPFELNKAEHLYVQKGEAYVRLHPALIYGKIGVSVRWDTKCFYMIENWPRVVEKLLSLDGALTWLCLWEEELYECVLSGIAKKLGQFTNPVVGLVCSNDLKSVEALMVKWREYIDGVTAIELTRPASLFIIMSVPIYKLMLVAPTVRATAALLRKRVFGKAGWSTTNPFRWKKEEVDRKWLVLLEGIATWAF